MNERERLYHPSGRIREVCCRCNHELEDAEQQCLLPCDELSEEVELPVFEIVCPACYLMATSAPGY